MCLYPTLRTNPKYISNKKNGGVVPPLIDERVKLVPTGCGKCIECRKKNANNWRTRLMEDIKVNKQAYFVTLTLSNESFTEIAGKTEAEGYALDNWVITKATRLFLERWRKKYKKSVRHWLVTELGHSGTENVHMHGLIWTDKPEEIERIWNAGTKEIEGKKIPMKYGYVYMGNYVNEQTINYIVKYLTKTDLKHKYYKPMTLTSAGIGGNYIGTHNAKLNKYKPGQTKETYTTRTGTNASVPIYWRNKIFSEEERERLWIEKLDKDERYVLGKKCKTWNEYTKALETARKKNKELGYGSDENNWDEELYENQIRKLKHEARKAPPAG